MTTTTQSPAQSEVEESDPLGGGIVDTLIGFAHQDVRASHQQILDQTRDRESREAFSTPVQYMFKETPELEGQSATPEGAVEATLREMGRFGVAVGLVALRDPLAQEAVTRYPERFVGSWSVDPNEGVQGLRDLVAAHARWGMKAITFFPCGTSPQVPIDDRKAYPYYARAVELGLPVLVNAGIPGPRVPSDAQRVERIEQVLYDFPELVFVTRHGCEPWVDHIVKLMVKWPNLHYSTTAFAPRYYPQAIIDYANTRGADRVLYGGYYPMGLSLERITSELRALPLRSDVWPKFLRTNAERILGLDPAAGS